MQTNFSAMVFLLLVYRIPIKLMEYINLLGKYRIRLRAHMEHTYTYTRIHHLFTSDIRSIEKTKYPVHCELKSEKSNKNGIGSIDLCKCIMREQERARGREREIDDNGVEAKVA